jgi:hypothetical protein
MLPLVLDDVLVNFDHRRAMHAAKTLQTFAELGHQVMMFTCHEHITRIFQAIGVQVRLLPEQGKPGSATILLPAEPAAPQIAAEDAVEDDDALESEYEEEGVYEDEPEDTADEEADEPAVPVQRVKVPLPVVAAPEPEAEAEAEPELELEPELQLQPEPELELETETELPPQLAADEEAAAEVDDEAEAELDVSSDAPSTDFAASEPAPVPESPPRKPLAPPPPSRRRGAEPVIDRLWYEQDADQSAPADVWERPEAWWNAEQKVSGGQP